MGAAMWSCLSRRRSMASDNLLSLYDGGGRERLMSLLREWLHTSRRMVLGREDGTFASFLSFSDGGWHSFSLILLMGTAFSSAASAAG